MKYKIIKNIEVFKKEKFGISLKVYPKISDCGVVLISTEKGHNEEFYNKKSTFNYLILEGKGEFFLDDEKVEVSNGDIVSIEPNTRIYYKGNLKMLLITNPAWKQEDEVETKPFVW